MNTQDHATEIGTGIVKLAPPVYVAGTSVMGVIDWQLWVYVLTAIYLVMQISAHAYKNWVMPWLKKYEVKDEQ